MTKNSVHNEGGDGGDVILGGDAGGRVLFGRSRLALNSVCSFNCPWTFDSLFSLSSARIADQMRGSLLGQ